jgi:hypothetical protein
MSWGEVLNEGVTGGIGGGGGAGGFPFEGPWSPDEEEGKKAGFRGPRFSELLRRLKSDERLVDDDPELFQVLLVSLKRALIYEMRRRGLWWAPPRYLGLVGSSWRDPEVFDELLAGAYEFVFVRRLPSLLDKLEVGTSVDGMVFFYLGKFLLEAQRSSDPLGARLYCIVEKAIRHLLESRRLFLLDGDPNLRTGTVLAFSPWLSVAACGRGEQLAERVVSWNDEFLPDLVTSHHHGPLAERLAEAMAALPEEGVEIFRFEDLFEPLKNDVRRRWTKIAEEEVDLAGAPPEGYEARRRFQDLLRCTAEGIGSLNATQRTREHLDRLWIYYRHWVVETGGSANAVDELPPDVHLGKLLSIPRTRLPGLREMLGQVVKSCQRPGFEGEEPERRGIEEDWQELRARTRAQVARWRADRTAEDCDKGPPESGDLYVLPGIDLPPVVWLVLEGRRGDRLPVVPVDELPFRGRRDLVLEGEAVARRAGKAWLPEETLAAGYCAGRASAGAMERLGQEVEEPPPALESSDGEPEYEEWIENLRDTGRRLGGLVGVPTRDGRSSSSEDAFSVVRGASRSSALALAAVLLAALGFSVLHSDTTSLRQFVGQLTGLEEAQPSVVRGEQVDHIRYRDTTRGAGEMLEIDSAREHFVFLDLYGIEEFPAFRVILLDAGGEEAWRSEPFEFDFDVRVVIPAGSLESGRYELLVYGVPVDGAEVLIEP